MPSRSLTATTGKTLKTFLRDYSSGAEKDWNTGTGAFEAYNSANIANYGITTTPGSPGDYSWAVPAGLPASTPGSPYKAVSYYIAGTQLAESDLEAGTTAWEDEFAWDGTKVVSLQSFNNALVGPSSVTLTFTDAGGHPVQNVAVNIVGQGIAPATAANGQTSFGLANGTYTIAAGPVGLTMWPATQIVVNGTTSATLTGTAIVITPATAPGTTTAYGTTRDGHGLPRPGVAITFRLVNPNGTADIWDTEKFTATSDANGLLQVTLIAGAVYAAQTPAGAWEKFTAGTGNTYALPFLSGPYA